MNKTHEIVSNLFMHDEEYLFSIDGDIIFPYQMHIYYRKGENFFVSIPDDFDCSDPFTYAEFLFILFAFNEHKEVSRYESDNRVIRVKLCMEEYHRWPPCYDIYVYRPGCSTYELPISIPYRLLVQFHIAKCQIRDILIKTDKELYDNILANINPIILKSVNSWDTFIIPFQEIKKDKFTLYY